MTALEKGIHKLEDEHQLLNAFGEPTGLIPIELATKELENLEELLRQECEARFLKEIKEKY